MTYSLATDLSPEKSPASLTSLLIAAVAIYAGPPTPDAPTEFLLVAGRTRPTLIRREGFYGPPDLVDPLQLDLPLDAVGNLSID